MTIEIRVHGTLAATEGCTQTVSASGLCLLDHLRAIGLEAGTYSLLVLNGDLVTAQAVPADGDVVDVYPPLCGGGE